MRHSRRLHQRFGGKHLRHCKGCCTKDSYRRTLHQRGGRGAQ